MKKPNIIFILSDDQGAWSLGSAGNKDIITPNLDKMAQEGMRFENYFCVSPVCSPSRASILTGMIPSGHGILDWIRSGSVDSKVDFPKELLERYQDEKETINYLEGLKTYPEILSHNGYTCALSGKWHLGDSFNPASGFSKWFTIGLGGCPYYTPDVMENGKITVKSEYVTDLITNKAINFLDELANDGNPFYLSVHYTAPHSPWDADNHPKEYLDLYKDCGFNSTPNEPLNKYQINSSPYALNDKDRQAHLTGYYAAITEMDANIGKILKKLDEKGIAEDTIVIFTADNGVCMGHHGAWGKGNATYPQNMYEQSIKVPFIFYRKGQKNAAPVPTGLYSHYDLFSTILALANINYTTNEQSPGRSFSNLLSGNKEDDDRNQVLILDEYGPVRMIRNDTYKYVHRYSFGECELYNIKDDPDEKNNLYNNPAMAELVDSMKKQMDASFDKYTIPKKEGYKYKVYGKGQIKKLDGIPCTGFKDDFHYINPKTQEEYNKIVK